jgi:GTPase SAR1 family protein
MSSRQVVVLIGMGGAGKTQLALEYCQYMKDSGTLQAIFWLDALSHQVLSHAMETIAKQLMPGRVLDKPNAAVTLVNEVLSSYTHLQFSAQRLLVGLQQLLEGI